MGLQSGCILHLWLEEQHWKDPSVYRTWFAKRSDHLKVRTGWGSVCSILGARARNARYSTDINKHEAYFGHRYQSLNITGITIDGTQLIMTLAGRLLKMSAWSSLTRLRLQRNPLGPSICVSRTPREAQAEALQVFTPNIHAMRYLLPTAGCRQAEGCAMEAAQWCLPRYSPCKSWLFCGALAI
jgi:hypothetical protein